MILDSRTANFLVKIFEKAEGKLTATVDIWSVANELGIERDEVAAIHQELNQLGFIKTKYMGGKCAITIQGKQLAEELQKDLNKMKAYQAEGDRLIDERLKKADEIAAIRDIDRKINEIDAWSEYNLMRWTP